MQELWRVVSSSKSAAVPAPDACVPRRAALLQQVMQLTAEQVASLPPAQRAQVEALQQHMVRPSAGVHPGSWCIGFLARAGGGAAAAAAHGAPSCSLDALMLLNCLIHADTIFHHLG